METQTATLRERYQAYKVENPKARVRIAAKDLGVSEAEIVASNCGDTATHLRPEFEAILSRVESLGYVMALTRNEEVVHERKGTYLNGEFGPHASLFVGADIDLRIFLSAWSSAFAVKEMSRGKERRSLQFFGKDGEAIHKIYLTDKSDVTAYDQLVEELKHENQSPTLSIIHAEAPKAELPDDQIEVEAFQEEWRKLKDTHDFFGMLRKYKVSRTQALRLAPEGNYATRVDNEAFRETINTVAKEEVPIMVFVGNKGCIQIHTGPVKKIFDHEDWFNVMDPEFNLHLKEPSISQSWIVRKPTVDGIVTSLEVFNDAGELIVTLFGKRKPGIPELAEWADVAARIEKSHHID